MKKMTDVQAFPVLQEAAFTREEENILKARLFALLSKQARLCTQGDHSSLREEDAAELLSSMLFTLRYALFLRGMPLRALLNADLHEMLKAGQQALRACADETEALYQAVLPYAAWYGNRALGDTLQSIGRFFGKYDPKLYAHRIPASIDYQLCVPVDEKLGGILYIQSYVRQLLIENELIIRFPSNHVHLLLCRVSPEYQELLINLYEPVAANAVGLALLGCDIKALEITRLQAAQIHKLLTALPKADVRKKTAEAAKAVCAALALADEQSYSYLYEAALTLYPRIAISAQSACGVFYACP